VPVQALPSVRLVARWAWQLVGRLGLSPAGWMEAKALAQWSTRMRAASLASAIQVQGRVPYSKRQTVPLGRTCFNQIPKNDFLNTEIALPGWMSGRQMSKIALKICSDRKVLSITGDAENTVFDDRHIMPGAQV
jgi:hypothetical protein